MVEPLFLFPPFCLNTAPGVRPGAAGLLTGVEYSRVGNSTWIRSTSTITTRTAVELAGVQGNYPTYSE